MTLDKIVFINCFVNFILLVSARICVQKGKYIYIPRRQNAHHCLGQIAHARGRFIPQFCQLESCDKLAIIEAMDT